jgi:SAM-dependent methyltransferase
MDLDANNRLVWRSRRVIEEYVGVTGWVDRGEEAAVASAAGKNGGRSVLDLGVGVGRTVPLMQSVASTYIGLDYSPEMVEASRHNHADADIRLGDARDLHEFEDGRFGLVTFSYNALDVLGRADRRLALHEMARVLAPDGRVVLSSLNLHGATYGRRPWQIWKLQGPIRHPLLRSLLSFPRYAGKYVRGVRNWSRTRGLSQVHEGWAIGPLSAHEFLLAVHFTSLSQARVDVAEADLQVEAIYGNDGEAIDPRSDDSDADFFHLVLAHR